MKFVLVTDLDAAYPDSYDLDPDAHVVEVVGELTNGKVAIEIAGENFVVSPSIIHTTDESASPSTLEEIAAAIEPVQEEEHTFEDADGNLGVVGDTARIRLSRMSKYGVEQADRSGTVVAHDSIGKATVRLYIGDVIVKVVDFRWGTDPEFVMDADGKVGSVGSSARLRLSRLTSFGVAKYARHGKITATHQGGTFDLVFASGDAVTVNQSDFRWN